MFQQLLKQFLQKFIKNMGRGPQNRAEWMQIQDDAVRYLNKTKGAPSIKKEPWHQGWTPKVIEGGKSKKGIESLMESGEVQFGTAPKTQKSTLDAKKERDLLFRDAEEDILRKKQENKDAIRRFKEKKYERLVKAEEDKAAKDPDYLPDIIDPDEFAQGGIAPLIGEPSYSADFYDDRIPYAGGLLVKGGKWFLNNLRRALKDIESNQGFKNLTPDRKEGLTSEIKNLIKKIEGGGPIPDEMIQTIRHDPKFATISKTRSTDPDLYEFEDVILNYGKKGDVSDQTIKEIKDEVKDVSEKMILEEFDPTNRLPNNSGGPINQEALIQMYLEEGLSYDEAVAAAQSTSGLDMDISKDEKAKGGRAGYIFGGSAGLKAMWKQMMKGINKGRDKPVKRLFPTLSRDERRMEKLVMGTPEQKAFREIEAEHKLEGIDLLINRLKHDKKILERRAQNKAMKDPNLDFLTEHMEKQMSDVYTPNLKKYTDIDKDILDMETIKKNLIMKDRKLNAYGGRVSYSGGGRAGLPAITYGMSQPEMQGPQMPATVPQPAGISGANLQQNQMDLMQQKMQQDPWMQNQMKQGIGGMQKPQYGGQFRMPFGLGGMSRRAFMKLMAGVAALPFIGKGASKVAPKAIKETTEVITRGADGMPTYITDLIEVVKAKGTRDIIEGVKRSNYSTVHRYKGVEVIEDAAGNTKIKSDLGGVATDPKTGKMHEGIAQEHHMQIEKGEWIEPTKTKKGIKTQDEYIEGTVRPDRDGKMKDFEDGLDEAVHLEFKKIADEVDTLIIKKASGGLAYALGE